MQDFEKHSNSIEELNAREQAQEQAAADSSAEFDEERITEAERHRQMLREELEKQRRAELMERLYGSFNIDSRGGWHTKRNNDLVFSADEKKIATDRNDQQTVQAMLDLAEARGWKGLRVKGEEDFRRTVWMEASLRGLEVEGFKPREADIQELEEKRRLRSHNAVEATPERQKVQAETSKPEQAQAAPEKAALLASKTPDKGQPELEKRAAKDLPPASKEEILTGRLIEHGMGESGYFVRINTALGEKVVVGDEFRHAIEMSKAKPGDRILLDNVGHKTIELEESKKAQEIVARSANDKALESAANQIFQQHVKDPVKLQQYMDGIRAKLEQHREQGTTPQVRVYDRAAPAQSDRDRAAPVVERHSERTR